MFDIYNKDVTIGGKTYTLPPLDGDNLAKLYSVLGKLKTEKDSEFNLSSLDETTVKVLHYLAMETFKQAYPKEDIIKLSKWVSQNLILLIEPLMLVNINSEELEKHNA